MKLIIILIILIPLVYFLYKFLLVFKAIADWLDETHEDY